MNRFGVGSMNGRIVIQPSLLFGSTSYPLQPNDALLLAAWIVAIAQPEADQDFGEMLIEIIGGELPEKGTCHDSKS
jgi:hypothetical protein